MQYDPGCVEDGLQGRERRSLYSLGDRFEKRTAALARAASPQLLERFADRAYDNRSRVPLDQRTHLVRLEQHAHAGQASAWILHRLLGSNAPAGGGGGGGGGGGAGAPGRAAGAVVGG